ncbi:MAG TPA: hypothetical protein VFB14_19260 [Bryobacteraceae bacterium]|jgi:hypothetical protein|nr:hypothetical protein [Bryobacteraceae bacterium]
MMTSGQIRAQLEQADRNLSEAVAQLLAGPLQNPGFHQSLQATADLLCGARTLARRADTRVDASLLHHLQTNAARAQRLLDSAAAFYGCAISPPCSDPAVYTPDGLLHSQE